MLIKRFVMMMRGSWISEVSIGEKIKKFVLGISRKKMLANGQKAM